jgi:hypothetical protein
VACAAEAATAAAVRRLLLFLLRDAGAIHSAYQGALEAIAADPRIVALFAPPADGAGTFGGHADASPGAESPRGGNAGAALEHILQV